MFDHIGESNADGINKMQFLVIEKYKRFYCYKNVITFFTDYETYM